LIGVQDAWFEKVCILIVRPATILAVITPVAYWWALEVYGAGSNTQTIALGHAERGTARSIERVGMSSALRP
jgi:hypothetical protein